jgi:DNA-binding response OmpR family regulator
MVRRVWGFKALVPTRTLDSHASRLRKKLTSGDSTFVVNVWGVRSAA